MTMLKYKFETPEGSILIDTLNEAEAYKKNNKLEYTLFYEEFSEDEMLGIKKEEKPESEKNYVDDETFMAMQEEYVKKQEAWKAWYEYVQVCIHRRNASVDEAEIPDYDENPWDHDVIIDNKSHKKEAFGGR